MVGLKLGQEAYTLTVLYRPARYDSEDDFPDGYEVISVRALVVDDSTCALVNENGKVIFRPKSLVFLTWEAAQSIGENINVYDLEAAILKID